MGIPSFIRQIDILTTDLRTRVHRHMCICKSNINLHVFPRQTREMCIPCNYTSQKCHQPYLMANSSDGQQTHWPDLVLDPHWCGHPCSEPFGSQNFAPKEFVSSKQWSLMKHTRMCTVISGWWLEHGFYFSIYIGNFIIPTDFHSIIFQRGRAQSPTSYVISIYSPII